MPQPFLLDETAIIGTFINFVLIVGGLFLLLLLLLGWHFFAAKADTASGKVGRFVLLLAAAFFVAYCLFNAFSPGY
jgi:hypothetical protein